MPNTPERTRENRLRRAAQRQALRIVKARRRDEHALDFGAYRIVDTITGATVGGKDSYWSLNDVEQYLTRPKLEPVLPWLDPPKTS